MKGLFLYYNNIEKGSMSGIDQKVVSQIKTLNDEGLNCTLSVMPYSGGKMSKLLYRLPFTNSFQVWNYKEEFKAINYLYFRRPGCFTKYTLKTLEKIKKNNPNMKIILEIPTYPYDKELFVKKRDIPLFFKDKINRNKLRGIVDRIVTLSNDELIFGIPTIEIVNGVDFDKISVRNIKTNNTTINLIAVSSMETWHGYDRLLKGLGEYYKQGGNKKVILHLVGAGEVLESYKLIVENYRIQDYVIFHGKKFDEDLNQIYDKCDIAVETLGCHRKNLFLSSSLKSREYLAKGLPIISSCKIDIIPTDWEYLLKVPEDDSDININKIIKFYEDLYKNKSVRLITEEIRSYGEKTCDMKNTMKPVIDYLRGE